jgi:hypothetical protein
MKEMISEFKDESKSLIEQMITILEEIEGDFNKKVQLENYGQVVDRIMGGAKSLVMAMDTSELIEKEKMEKVGSYTELCKIVGYKGSQIESNQEFYNIVVALLLDATEMLDKLVENLGNNLRPNLKEVVSNTFLDRLRWVSQHFPANIRGSVAVDKGVKKSATQSQEEIDALLKQMGLN